MSLRTIDYFAIALGGSVGSVARAYLVELLGSYQGKLPLGVAFVNLLGSFLIGALAALVLLRGVPSETWRVGIMIGLLGGFTTFSSFSYEMLTLLKGGLLLQAMLNVVLQVIGGVVLAALGYYCARAVLT